MTTNPVKRNLADVPYGEAVVGGVTFPSSGLPVEERLANLERAIIAIAETMSTFWEATERLMTSLQAEVAQLRAGARVIGLMGDDRLSDDD